MILMDRYSSFQVAKTLCRVVLGVFMAYEVIVRGIRMQQQPPRQIGLIPAIYLRYLSGA